MAINPDKFGKIAESLRQYRRAELSDFQSDVGGNPVELLYVDPLESDAVLKTVLLNNTTFLVGRKGTGKSTVFAKAQIELRKRTDAISVYVDVKSLHELLATNEAPVQSVQDASIIQTMATMKTTKKELSPKQRDELLATLKTRFDANQARHPGLLWAKVQARLEVRPEKLWSLAEMERTGGEPDVIGQNKKSGEFVFMDCSAQSPKGRVSFCYDRASLDARKEHKPKNCVLDAAAYMGVGVLTEEEYFALQKQGEFDTKSSSWLQTPAEIRELGGAIYGDRRYGRVFIGHNGAESYYSGRGFRGSLKV